MVELRTVYRPPLICLVTSPRSDEGIFCNDPPPTIGKSVNLGTLPKRQRVHFNPGRRVQNSTLDSRPILVCATCAIRPKGNFCNNCFEQNYIYVHRVSQLEKKPRSRKEIELRSKLRDLFGESDISD